jgi:hypothetical protein
MWEAIRHKMVYSHDGCVLRREGRFDRMRREKARRKEQRANGAAHGYLY